MGGPAISPTHLEMLEAAHDLLACTPVQVLESLAQSDGQYRERWLMYLAACEAFAGPDEASTPGPLSRDTEPAARQNQRC